MKMCMPGILSILLLAGNTTVLGQEADSIWKRLEPYFNTPPKYAGRFGNYPTPLKFYDGRPVKNANDWKTRKKEIAARWQQLMGPWPPLIANPAAEMIDSIHRENFTQYRVRFAWRTDETTEGYLLVPDVRGKKPAVVTVFYEPETAIGLKKPYMDFALQLARRGFIALSVGTDFRHNERPYAQYFPNAERAVLQPLSMLAYLAANAYNMLATRPDVDPARIGITGHSYGSKWAMFASCLYDKYACAAWSDGGVVFDESRPNVNYWDPWYLGYYPQPWEQQGFPIKKDTTRGAYPLLVKEGHDLVELHALMAPRPFLVSGGSEDSPERWTALNHAVEVNKLLGYENRVGMTNRPDHTPTTGSNETLCLFFEYFLKYDGLNMKNHH